MNNGNLKLVDPAGTPVATVGGKAKRAHDSDRVGKERMRLMNVLNDMKDGWAKDNGIDPSGATTPNRAAIDTLWIEKWEATARAVLAATEPVDVDVDAMRTWIAGQRAHNERQAQYKMPLKEVLDLSAWEFRLVGKCILGTVWLCDRAALCVDTESCVFVVLRPVSTPMMMWADAAWLSPNAWGDALELPDFTLGDLFMLLKVLRYTKLSALPEPLMAIARGGHEVTEPLKSPVEN